MENIVLVIYYNLQARQIVKLSNGGGLWINLFFHHAPDYLGSVELCLDLSQGLEDGLPPRRQLLPDQFVDVKHV